MNEFNRQMGSPPKPRRYVCEVVEVTCTCEIGVAGERAVVTDIDGKYMTLVFTGELRDAAAQQHRPTQWRTKARIVRTGTDYAYLRHVQVGE